MRKDPRVFLEHLEITWVVVRDRLPELRARIVRILSEFDGGDSR